jgi:hypothetical protein
MARNARFELAKAIRNAKFDFVRDSVGLAPLFSKVAK